MLGRSWFIVVCFALVACGEGDTPAAPTPDAGPARDAGSTIADAGSVRDAGPPRDGGVVTRDGGPETGPRFVPFVASVRAELDQLGAPGVAVAIVEGGAVTFARGFGSRHPDDDVPVEPTTLFRIGSVNKVLTAAVMLGLVESSTYAMTDPITDVIPQFSLDADPAWAPTVRLEHVVSHQSGIQDYTRTEVPPTQMVDGALDSFLTGEFGQIAYPMSPAGAFYNYANPNFSLAGLAIERLTQTGYRDVMRTRLFTPLGMDRTMFLPSEVFADRDYAVGLSADAAGQRVLIQPDAYDNAWGRPAGFAFSSVLDLAEFVRFLRDGDERVVSAAGHAALQSPQVDTRQLGDIVHYGYGLTIIEGLFMSGGRFIATRFIQHDGAIRGFSASLWWVPAADFGIIFLANTDGAYFLGALTTALDTIATLPASSIPPDVAADSSRFADYAGSYFDPFNVGAIDVRVDAGRLLVTMPLLDANGVSYQPSLLPTSRDNFRLSIQGFSLPVTFIPDAQGGYGYFRTRNFVGARRTMVAPPVVSFDRERFERHLEDASAVVEGRSAAELWRRSR